MILNRFISIDSLFEILSQQRLRLSKPEYWDDKNDATYLEYYRDKKNLKNVFALCFTDDAETIYHWPAFSFKGNACCIHLEGDSLIQSISDIPYCKHGKVSYLRINELKSKLTKIDDIPFSKRYPYRNESEYRIIYHSKKKASEKYIDIDLSIIKKITINQIISMDVYMLIKAEITKKYGISVNRSTIYNNSRWINHIKAIEK